MVVETFGLEFKVLEGDDYLCVKVLYFKYTLLQNKRGRWFERLK